MKIKLSPQFAITPSPLSMSVDGDVLTINGVEFDFSPLGEGDVLPVGSVPMPVLGRVTRADGEVVVTILFQHLFSASEAARFPDPITITSGNVELPS